MSARKIYHYVDLDDAHHWCEGCSESPPGVKVYIDEYKGCNPAYWCEKCVNGGLETVKFEIIGWLHKEEYLKQMQTFYSKNWSKY